MIVPYKYYRGHWNDELKRYEDDTSCPRGIDMEYFGDGEGYMGRCNVRDEGRKFEGVANTPDGDIEVYAPRRSASIWAVKIEEEYRGMGHGSRMMVETMDMVKSMGYGDAYLVCSGGIVARKAYERAGFIMTNESEAHPNNGRMDWVRPS